jgi:hypothetical protein
LITILLDSLKLLLAIVLVTMGQCIPCLPLNGINDWSKLLSSTVGNAYSKRQLI